MLFRGKPTILTLGCFINVNKIKYKKPIKKIRKVVPFRFLQYLQYVRMVSNGSIGLSQILSNLHRACRPFNGATYRLQSPKNPFQCCLSSIATIDLHGYCLLSTSVPFDLQASTFKYFPFLLPYTNFYLPMVVRNIMLQRLKIKCTLLLPS